MFRWYDLIILLKLINKKENEQGKKTKDKKTNNNKRYNKVFTNSISTLLRRWFFAG